MRAAVRRSAQIPPNSPLSSQDAIVRTAAFTIDLAAKKVKNDHHGGTAVDPGPPGAHAKLLQPLPASRIMLIMISGDDDVRRLRHARYEEPTEVSSICRRACRSFFRCHGEGPR
jgi:hypothetical protein